MKLLVTSDLHLSERIWRYRPIEGDAYWAWQQIVDMAISHDVDYLIMAGDVLDKQVNSAEPVHQLIAGFNQLAKANVEVLYTQGQHELQSTPWCSLAKNAKWIHNKIEQLANYNLVGCDYLNQEELQKFLKTKGSRAQQADVLVMHQVWLEFMGAEAKPQGSFEDLPERTKLLITGDYHQHICRREGNIVVLSPGSTHLRSLAEPEDKYVFLLNFEQLFPALPKIQSLPLTSRQMLRLTHKTLPTTTQAIEKFLANLDVDALPEKLQKPIVRIQHDYQDTSVHSLLTKFGDELHLFFKPINQEEESTDVVTLLPEVQVDVTTCLDQFISKQETPEAYDLALRLLQGGDPKSTLQAWVQEKVHAH